MLRLILIAAALPIAVPVPHPGEVKTFKDWAVGCDNGKRCTLASLGPDGGGPPTATMNVVREAGPEDVFRIELHAYGDTAKPTGIVIDGKRHDGVFSPTADGALATGAVAAEIATALANARILSLTSADGRTLATLSTAGTSAALRYIDVAQGRSGGSSALVAKGAKDAASVPAAPSLPVIAAPRLAGRASLPTAPQIGALRRSAHCDDPGAATFKTEAYALGTGRTLALIPCSIAAYNISAAVFLIENGKPRPAQFDAPTGFGEDPQLVPMVVNARYSGGVLTSYAKGRGLGDCGTAQSFVWDGTRFRLSEMSQMGECRGNPAFITTWRARVVPH